MQGSSPNGCVCVCVSYREALLGALTCSPFQIPTFREMVLLLSYNIKIWQSNFFLPILFSLFIAVLEGLVMKPCHENNGAEIYVGRAATLHNPLF